MTTTKRPWLLLHATDSANGQVTIHRNRFTDFDAARAAAEALSPDLAGNGWVLPNLPASAWAKYGDEAYEQGFYYADVNRYAVIIRTTTLED